MTATRIASTMIELLVVIAIIAMLAALLVPAISLVRSSVNATKCTSNLRQIGVAVVCYARENDDLVPPGYAIPSGTWQSLIDTYLTAFGSAKVLVCPASTIRKGALHYSAQFALFPNLPGKPSPNRVKSGRLDELRANGVLIFDGSQNPATGNADPLSTEQPSMWEFYGENTADDAIIAALSPYNLSDVVNQRTARFRHGANNRACFLYGDLHAAARGTSDVTRGEYRSYRNSRKWSFETWIP